MEVSEGFRLIYPLALAGVVGLFLHLYNTVWLSSQRVRKKLRMQGIRGPDPCFFYGNLPEMQRIQLQVKNTPNNGGNIGHDYTSTLFPYFEQWRKQYGPVFTYSTGARQHLYVNDPEIVKELNQSTSLDLGKPCYMTKRLAPMLGNGIIRSNGLTWAQQRKIIAPEFFMDRVKGMLGLMLESVQPLLKNWDESIGSGITAEVTVDEDLRGVSADMISRACFGNSHFLGREIFSKLRILQQAMSRQSILFGHSRGIFLPQWKRPEISRLEREIETLIWNAVRERERESLEQKSSPKDDLMQLLMEGAMNDRTLRKDCSKSFIVDNCKSIYFAGHESTAAAASWSLMLLALHPEWQARIRAEVSQICPQGVPDIASLPQLKTVTMVINEALRLYPPASFVSREALEETQIGNIVIPKGVCLWTLIPTLHRDPDIWGPDANEFKPQRFSDGISSACKFPQAYIPFGVGPRLCLGRNFAVVQLKVILSLVVHKFSFTLSPKYQHSPSYKMIVEPGHGLQILIQRKRS